MTKPVDYRCLRDFANHNFVFAEEIVSLGVVRHSLYLHHVALLFHMRMQLFSTSAHSMFDCSRFVCRFSIISTRKYFLETIKHKIIESNATERNG